MAGVALIRSAWSVDAVDVLSAAFSADPWGGLATPAEVLHGSVLLEAVDGSKPVGLVATKTADFAHGREVCVIGVARSVPGTNAIASFSQPIFDLAAQAGANVVTAVTGKPAVRSAMMRAGWEQSGVIMIKRIKVQ